MSGDLGSQGVAVLSVRENLSFAGDIVSDSAPLYRGVADLMAGGEEERPLRHKEPWEVKRLQP